jgi:hypothetical protein
MNQGIMMKLVKLAYFTDDVEQTADFYRLLLNIEITR